MSWPYPQYVSQSRVCAYSILFSKLLFKVRVINFLMLENSRLWLWQVKRLAEVHRPLFATCRTFISTWRTPVSICCRTGLFAMNFSFCSSGTIQISLSFEWNVAKYKFLVDSSLFFSLSTLNMSLSFLLSFRVFDEKYAINVIENFVCVMTCFFFVVFTILCFLLSAVWLQCVSVWIPLGLSCLELLSFLDM